MSNFKQFKTAVALLAECADGASGPAEFVQRLAAKRDNDFYDIDFWAYACALQNTVQEGLDEAMNGLVEGFEGEGE